MQDRCVKETQMFHVCSLNYTLKVALIGFAGTINDARGSFVIATDKAIDKTLRVLSGDLISLPRAGKIYTVLNNATGGAP